MWCGLVHYPDIDTRDIDFIFHIALGLFVKRVTDYDLRDPQREVLDAENYQAVLKEAVALNLDYQCMIDKRHLLELTDDFSSIASSQEFVLGR